MNFYPVFLREMLIFKKRLMKPGYIFSSLVTPLLYLLAFGLGLGKGMVIEGISYLAFVVPGICAMSSMTNSYNGIATSLAVGRIHYKSIDEFIISPISPSAIVTGEILGGMVRGLFSSSLILIAGALFGVGFPSHPLFFLVWILNCLIFASVGVIAGFMAKSHEDTSMFSNFLIMPMAFFCGTFFPVDRLPSFVKAIIHFLPLTHAVRAMRSGFTGESVPLSSVGILFLVLAGCFGISVYAVKRSVR